MFTHSIILANEPVTADGILTLDLPVNPITALLVNLAPLGDNAGITNYASIQALASAIDLIDLRWLGQSVISCRGDDYVALLHLFHRIAVTQSGADEADNIRRSLVLPLLLGRKAYDPLEAFPRTRRGELQLQLTLDIADTGYDGLTVSVEAIELPEATPTHYQRVTTLAQTFAAIGDNDLALPIGNPIRAILGFGTTAFAGAAPAPTLGAMSLLRDNSQIMYTSTDFETLRAVAALSGRQLPAQDEHIHSVNAAGAGREDTLAPKLPWPLLENYALMDLTPTGNDVHILQTQGASSVTLRVNAETADAARFVLVERIAVGSQPVLATR